MSAPGHRLLRAGLRAALVLSALGAASLLVLLLAAALTPLPPGLLEPPRPSVRVEDSAGRLLREQRSGDGAKARLLGRGELGASFSQALIAAEDRRFLAHHGVDFLAALRALGSNLRHLRVVSGASTLTMQLARTVRPHPRTLRGKLSEMALALRIERSLSKEEILLAYANRVDFGPNLRGAWAASQAYLAKPPSALSLAEAALLAGLPQGPSLYAVARHPGLARRRREVVLGRMERAGMITFAQHAQASAEPLLPRPDAAVFGAPHLVSALLSGGLAAEQPGLSEAMADGAISSVQTTIDGALQRQVEGQVASVIESLRARHATAGAVVVVENATGDVLVYVGSPDFFDEASGGQNDGVRALRQPGSALKPFLYELAMERLGLTAASVLPDIELHVALDGGGDFAPRNYDGKLHGPVRLRQALGNSLNIPAIWTAERVGPLTLLERLQALGFGSLGRPAEYYGPALGLGDGEVSLLALARGYAALARGGRTTPLRFVRSLGRVTGETVLLETGEGRQLLDRDASWVISDILADDRARSASFGERSALAFPFRVAAKTGTSKGFRDNWAVGYTAEVTVAAWVGNFDGSAMDEVSGITGAGPIFHAAMESAMQRRGAAKSARDEASPQTDRPDSLRRVAVCPLSGQLSTARCGGQVFEWLPQGAAEQLAPCETHRLASIDRRNGLLAGAGCPPAFVEVRPVEALGPEYAGWAQATARPVAPREYSPLCPGEPEGGDGEPLILYPHDHARFVIDPDRPLTLQAIEVSAVGGPAGGALTLWVDGSRYATRPPPFLVSWPLEPGEHELVVAAGGARSEAVRISVRR